MEWARPGIVWRAYAFCPLLELDGVGGHGGGEDGGDENSEAHGDGFVVV